MDILVEKFGTTRVLVEAVNAEIEKLKLPPIDKMFIDLVKKLKKILKLIGRLWICLKKSLMPTPSLRLKPNFLQWKNKSGSKKLFWKVTRKIPLRISSLSYLISWLNTN